jgi:hypothetical protein
MWIRGEPLRWESGSSAVAGEILDCSCCGRAVRTGRFRGVCAVVVRRLTNEESLDGTTPGLHHRRPRLSVAAVVVVLGLTNATTAAFQRSRHGRVQGVGALACTTSTEQSCRRTVAVTKTSTNSTSPTPRHCPQNITCWFPLATDISRHFRVVVVLQVIGPVQAYLETPVVGR